MLQNFSQSCLLVMVVAMVPKGDCKRERTQIQSCLTLTQLALWKMTGRRAATTKKHAPPPKLSKGSSHLLCTEGTPIKIRNRKHLMFLKRTLPRRGPARAALWIRWRATLSTGRGRMTLGSTISSRLLPIRPSQEALRRHRARKPSC